MRTTTGSRAGALVLCLAGAVVGSQMGCEGAPDEAPPAATVGEEAAGEASSDTAGAATDTAGPAAPDSARSLRGVLPELFGIMTGLQDDMRRLDRGLWIESWDTIAVAARAVADHPTVPPEEFQRISGVLGDDMSAFRDMDRNVHDLAVEIEEHARAGRLEQVLATGVELRRGCVACHTAFRQRLREELGGAGSR